MGKSFEDRQRERALRRQQERQAAKKVEFESGETLKEAAEKIGFVYDPGRQAFVGPDGDVVSIDLAGEMRKMQEAAAKAAEAFGDFGQNWSEAMQSFLAGFRSAGARRGTRGDMIDAMTRAFHEDPPRVVAEMVVDDEAVMPQTPPCEVGVYIVYKDDGLIPQVHRCEPEDVKDEQVGGPLTTGGKVATFDPWLDVEYLIGEDLDPCTIISDHGEKYEVLAYRRADSKGNVYQEGWVGVSIDVPEEFLEKEPPRSRARSNVTVNINGKEFGEWRGRGPVTARDVILAANRMGQASFVDWAEKVRPVQHTPSEWLGLIAEILVRETHVGDPESEVNKTAMEVDKKHLAEVLFAQYNANQARRSNQFHESRGMFQVKNII